jgi:anti-anti-sigma regulatory factor
MFRAEIRWLENGPTLKMEGKLAGDWAEQARNLVTKDLVPKGLVVDLTEVSYVDSAGEQLLKWLASVGTVFVARSIYANAICERLHLSPVQKKVERHKRQHGSCGEKSSMKYSRPIEAI